MAPDLSELDEKTCVMLESKARRLLASAALVDEGDCQERAIAALQEAAAILRDSAAFCRRMSRIHPEREH